MSERNGNLWSALGIIDALLGTTRSGPKRDGLLGVRQRIAVAIQPTDGMAAAGWDCAGCDQSTSDRVCIFQLTEKSLRLCDSCLAKFAAALQPDAPGVTVSRETAERARDWFDNDVADTGSVYTDDDQRAVDEITEALARTPGAEDAGEDGG